MKRPPPLSGQAPRDKFKAQTGDGDPIEPQHAIFPIMSQLPSGEFRPIGTGFFVANNGVFLTAAHVIDDVLDEDGEPTAPFGIFQFAANNKYLLRPILRTNQHRIADVAVGVTAPMTHDVTGEPLKNKVLIVAGRQPTVGEPVCTYAYPKTEVAIGKVQRINFRPAFFEGKVTEFLPDGRDRVLLPGPCYRTSIVVHGGASGGPVFSSDGSVFGINSTGFEDDEISYISCVADSLSLRIRGVVLPGNTSPKSVSLQDLCDAGFIVRTDPPS